MSLLKPPYTAVCGSEIYGVLSESLCVKKIHFFERNTPSETELSGTLNNLAGSSVFAAMASTAAALAPKLRNDAPEGLAINRVGEWIPKLLHSQGGQIH